MANTYSFHCICGIQYKDGHKADERMIYNTPYELGDINTLTTIFFARKYKRMVSESLKYNPDIKDFTIRKHYFSFDLQ